MVNRRAGECPLCGRFITLTFHHLIPKKLHRRTRYRKNYSKAELNSGVWVCRLCHDGIHDHHDEMILAKRFYTIDRLKADPNIQRHCEWVARQKVST